MFFESQVTKQLLGAEAPSCLAAPENCQRPPGTYNRVEQTAGGNTIAELQPVGHNSFDPQVLRQRPHDVIQALADEDDLPVLSDPFAQLRHAFAPELMLQLVLEVFFAEQIQAVAAHTAQEHV